MLVYRRCTQSVCIRQVLLVYCGSTSFAHDQRTTLPSRSTFEGNDSWLSVHNSKVFLQNSLQFCNKWSRIEESNCCTDDAYFLARDSMLSALYAIARPSVRLCPSVTRVDQSKTVERIIEILSPSGRPNISFSTPKVVA